MIVVKVPSLDLDLGLEPQNFKDTLKNPQALLQKTLTLLSYSKASEKPGLTWKGVSSGSLNGMNNSERTLATPLNPVQVLCQALLQEGSGNFV